MKGSQEQHHEKRPLEKNTAAKAAGVKECHNSLMKSFLRSGEGGGKGTRSNMAPEEVPAARSCQGDAKHHKTRCKR